MVPCPTCNWINQSLVDDYRQTRYRDFSNFALPILGVGLVASAVCAILSLTAVADPKPLRAFAVGSLAAAVGGWWLLTSLQKSFRRRINPNATFPNPPAVPPGTPVALVQELDPRTGETCLAPTTPVHAAIDDGGPDLWVLFHAGQIYFPPFCCVCMAPATKVYNSPLKVDSNSDVALPLCRSCSLRLTLRWWLLALLLLATIAALSAVLALTVTTGDLFGRSFLFGLLGLFAAVICLVTIPAALTRPYRFKVIDRPRGILKLSASNPHFTRLLIQQLQPD